MSVSLADRLALFTELAAAQPGLPNDAHALARAVSDELGSVVEVNTAQAWLDGLVIPSDSERRAIAAAFHYHGDNAVYVVSDDPTVYMDYFEYLSTFVAFATNGTGLVALRSLDGKPLSKEAIQELGQLP